MSTPEKLPRTLIPLVPESTTVTSRFRVLTFNILADGLAQHGDFVKAPRTALEWKHRLPLLLKELEEADADIICLEECNHFDDISASLGARGYSGAFLAKCSSPAEKYDCPADGVAVFFRTHRYTCLHGPAGQLYTNEGGQRSSQGYMAVLLEDTIYKRRLCVCATHLKAKAGAANEAVRVMQAQQLLQHVQELSTSLTLAAATAHPSHQQAQRDAPSQADTQDNYPAAVVVCGDFNTTPESATCKEIEHHPLQLRSLWTVAENGAQTDVSAAASTTASEEFSTWKFRSDGETKRTIDYVWFTSERGLQPLARWRMLREEEIGPAGLPCERYPSDHVAVMCEFGWKSNS